MANLNNIIGLPTETTILIRDEMNYTTYETTEKSCVEYAPENRPDYFSAEYSIKQAEAAIKIADSIRLEVHNDYIDLRTAEENIATTKIAVDRAEEDYRLAQIRYIEGVGTNLEVIDAQEKLTQARTNYSSSLYSYNVAKSSLEKAMGVPIDIDVPSYISERR